MRHICLGLMCATAIMLIGCGGGSSTPVTGNWSAMLNNSTGATVLAFSATLTQGSSTVLSVTNVNLSTPSSCFGTGATATSTLTGNAFQMTLLSESSNLNGMNQVVLQGTMANGAISGTWDLSGTGTGCMGTGSFAMSR
jgi:hypothetical protein